MGESAHLYPRSAASRTALAIRFMVLASTGSITRKRPVNHLKCLGNFRLELLKMGGEQRGLRVDYDVEPDRRLRRLQPHRLAQAASHAIALYSTTQYFSHRKTNAELRRRLCLQFVAFAAEIKNRHMGREMPSPFFVDAIKIRVPQ